MEQNKMTPTPWVAGGTYPYKGNEGYILDTSKPEVLVCKTFGSIDENSPPLGEQAANSKAIVTAVNFTYGASINPEAVPDLLASLNVLIERYSDMIISELSADPDDHPDIHAAKAAIEKAKL